MLAVTAVASRLACAADTAKAVRRFHIPLWVDIRDHAFGATSQATPFTDQSHSILKMAQPDAPATRVVGLALKRDKRKKHISDKLLSAAAEAGIELRFIDKEVPLEGQGPFAAILQKVRKPGETPSKCWSSAVK